MAGSSVAVVGGGLGGLAAACVAASRGHDVTLYDKNAWIGGKAAVLHEGGFRFDMGPTILTVPRVLERIFAESGRSVHDYMDLRRLDPQWRCFFDDGSRIDLMENVSAMAAEMDRFAPGQKAGEGYKRFLALSEHLHGVSEKFFFWKPVQDLFDTIDIRANLNPGTLRDVLSLRMHASSPAPSGARCAMRASPRCSTTSCNMSAPRPTARRRCSAPSPTCRPPTGSGTRWAAPGRWPRG